MLPFAVGASVPASVGGDAGGRVCLVEYSIMPNKKRAGRIAGDKRGRIAAAAC